MRDQNVRYDPDTDSVQVYYGEVWNEILPANIQIMIPPMTSNTCDVGTASSYLSSTGFEAYRAFDRNDTTYAVAGNASGGISIGPSWVAFTFNFARRAVKVSLKNFSPNGAYRCKDFKIQASNDGTEFDDLTNVLTLPEDTMIHYYNLNNTKKYLIYRIWIISVSWTGGGSIGIGEMQLYGS